MRATIDCPTCLEGAEFSFDHDWIDDEVSGTTKKMPAWQHMNQIETVRESLRIGIPLHRVEEYLEWRDVRRQC